jgi:flagellar biosynthesis protein FlhB
VSADKAQKRFDATPARKFKAKRDGNVARSSEVGAITAFGCAAFATLAVLPFIGAPVTALLAQECAHPDPAQLPVAFMAILATALIPASAAGVGAVAAGLFQAGGLRFNVPKFAPAVLNPLAGIKRMIGAEAAVGALRAIVAFTIATIALWPVASDIFARALTLDGVGAFGQLGIGGAARGCASALAVGACFAAADYALVRRRWLHGLKMTLEEVRRDQKENDGDPHARSRRKTLHRNLVRGSIARTKEASFVVVNPTHIAIAIRYAPPDVAVPEILVRAADDGALAVRTLARTHGIPIVENVALARALFAHGEAGRCIPADTFVAVARVIAALIREGILT